MTTRRFVTLLALCTPIFNSAVFSIFTPVMEWRMFFVLSVAASVLQVLVILITYCLLRRHSQAEHLGINLAFTYFVLLALYVDGIAVVSRHQPASNTVMSLLVGINTTLASILLLALLGSVPESEYPSHLGKKVARRSSHPEQKDP